MTEIKINESESLFHQIKCVLDEARMHIAHTVNTTMVHAFWKVGKYIVEYEQQGNQRAEYGKSIIPNLSKRLTAEYGSGFNATNLKMMRQFYLLFQNGHTVCDKLSWSHYRQLIRIHDDTKRNYYINECVAANWSVRQLQRQINSMYYERMLASRDKETVRAEITKSVSKTLQPREIIHDPFILEST